MSDHSLISQYRVIHSQNPDYGAGSRHYEYVRALLLYFGFSSALDYGCGKGILADQITRSGVSICGKFDPAIPEYDRLPPDSFDVVINTDVLEHIPEIEIPHFLGGLRSVSNNAIIIPHLAKARQILPNGENAHCTIKSPEEWQTMLQQAFSYVYRLPHDSRVHALFYCAEQPIDARFLQVALQAIADTKPRDDEVRVGLGQPFLFRLKKAIKLVLGARVSRVLSRKLRVPLPALK